MTKSILLAAALAFGLAAPAFAASDMMECNDASMAKMKTEVMGMSDGTKKTMAMDHMKMAQDSMMKKDMKACTMHMQETMKAMK